MNAGEFLLGEWVFSHQSFAKMEEIFREFLSESFAQQNVQQRSDAVSKQLLRCIEEEKMPCFLLPAVLDFVEKVNLQKVIEGYNLYHFELWLNQFSGLSEEDNRRIRGKIVGKYVPRDAYQELFPIGMGKKYAGSHYVTAHSSPDLDTTVASFWGWVDAFAAPVCEGVHVWNLPGGPPSAQVEIGFLFSEIFGAGVFDHLPKTRTSLSLSGIDLLSQQGVVRKPVHLSTLNIEHEKDQQAVLLLDEEGRYLGDWRTDDIDMVRQVINWLNGCLRWIENDLHSRLVELFAKEKVTVDEVLIFAKTVLHMSIEDAEPAQEFSVRQKKVLEDYLKKVLSVPMGLGCTVKEFASAMATLRLDDFAEFVALIEGMAISSLFDASGRLQEDRTAIFNLLEKVIKALDRAIYSMRLYVERLDVALQIKNEVFGCTLLHVSYRADVEEIRSKIDNLPYITVTAPTKEGWVPLGVVYANDLHKPTLGTVTLRDFCNREETKIPPYFEIISVLDHHKSALQTLSAPMVVIADAQSSNVLCAEKAFIINDAYGLGGMTLEQVQGQCATLQKDLSSGVSRRLMGRLLQRMSAVERSRHYFIDPRREYTEYLHFIYAILDDTDLLTKMTLRDVECVVSLLNRMKSIIMQKEVETISVEDLPRGEHFVAEASARILKNVDMRSLYRKVYQQKEALVSQNIHAAVRGEPSSLFDDTKEQNGCNRVGQTKIFNGNYLVFVKYVDALRALWCHSAIQFYKERPEVDLHLYMISTISRADEGLDKPHQDELWIWIPSTEQSIGHLKGFLNAFRRLPQWEGHTPVLELYGAQGKEYERIFDESFFPITKEERQASEGLSMAVLKYDAGLINSRKAMISPYLPRL